MVRAWYMDTSTEDMRLEHIRQPPEFIDMETVKKLTGVLYWKLNVETLEADGVLESIRKERGYTYQDVLEISPSSLPDYEERSKIFFTEHLHKEEEIRLVLEGSGYWDVRTVNDDWIRIEMLKGDLIILPPDLYHRLTVDTNEYLKALRLFIGKPIWTPFNRATDGTNL